MLLSLFMSVLCFIQQPLCEDQLTLVDSGETITTVDRDEFSLLLPTTPVIDWMSFDLFAAELDELIRKEPQNAYLDDYGHIQPEKIGSTLNKQQLKKAYIEYFYSSGAKSLAIPKQPVYPVVDSELLTRITTSPIGYYVTYFNSYNQSRTNNIKKAAEAINNYVVFPGQTFSFNQAVGKRTKGKGYMPAPIIVRGELSEGIGGGICQVSSTLFNAVDKGKLTIVERYSHSKRVSYVPPGRDATVSWYGPDFVFRNPYKEPIFIRAKVYGGSVSVILFSSEEVKNSLMSKGVQ